MTPRVNRAKYDPHGVYAAAVKCGNPRVGFEISIGADVIPQLKWKAGDYVNVVFGDPANKQLAKVHKTNMQRGYRLLANGHKLRMRTTAYPPDVAFTVAQRKTPVKYEVKDRELHIEFPSWFYGQA